MKRNGIMLRIVTIASLVCSTFSALAGDRLSGSVTCVGSDTASALVTRWATAFLAKHPKARIQVQGAGSASALPALTEGAADIGSMSRPMNAREEADFRARYGYAPTQVIVARDAIVVFVHPDNPLNHITLAELDAIYSTTRHCGALQPILHWRDLDVGANSELGAEAILATGRNATSGTYELFRESALCGGTYRPQVIAWPGNGAIVATVSTNREAIGYAGIGYVNGLIKPLALARNNTEAGVMPDIASVTDGRYPLSRALYMYINRPPHHVSAELPSAFIEYALSDEGQTLVRQEGFVPLGIVEKRVQRSIIE